MEQALALPTQPERFTAFMTLIRVYAVHSITWYLNALQNPPGPSFDRDIEWYKLFVLQIYPMYNAILSAPADVFELHCRELSSVIGSNSTWSAPKFRIQSTSSAPKIRIEKDETSTSNYDTRVSPFL